ncbi:MAG: HAD family hydrolase [Candidatus Thermoplasmatota archaeon]|nr:HAD family hydrolase [Candidatus Thermoplasmatota archaeon]MDD5778941.1 HAD family hydrolase [Candidatus Thermoplasmatota archaeon]
MVRVVSFDMDGTLIQQDYVNHVWLEGIPRLYARRRGLSLAEARRLVEAEYHKVGEDDLLWYDIQHWIETFGLQCHWRDLLHRYAHLLRLYPEVPEVLNRLRGSYQLIIISNAAREFIQVETETLGITDHFDHIFSAVTDFQQTKKHPLVYQRICDTLGVNREDVVHVGDSWDFDYCAPRSAGITSYYLDRDGAADGPYVLKDLETFARKLAEQ